MEEQQGEKIEEMQEAEEQRQLNALELYEQKKREIIEQCQQSRSLWVDPDLPANGNSLYKDIGKVPDFAKEIKSVRWVRPHEIAKDAKFVIDFEGDFKQGAFAESWFVGAVIIIGQLRKQAVNKRKPQQDDQLMQIEKLIFDYDHFEDYGFVTFQFFKNGDWKQVTVDTLLPFD